MTEWLHGLVWLDLVGILGVIIYIGSYFCLQAGMIKGQGYLYAALNATAASLVLLSLLQTFNLPSAIIQATYIVISVFGIVRFYLLSHRIKFNEEEQAFIEVVAPGLQELDARRLLDLGIWNASLPGVLLTEKGEPPEYIYFLYEGAAKVEVDGVQVATLKSKSLVGEMSYLTGLPASASVCLTEQSRMFSISIKKFNDFLARHDAVRHELQSRFATQVTEKLVKANAALATKS